MPIQPPILEDQASLNAWLDQTTEEVNELRDQLQAALDRIEALENP